MVCEFWRKELKVLVLRTSGSDHAGKKGCFAIVGGGRRGVNLGSRCCGLRVLEEGAQGSSTTDKWFRSCRLEGVLCNCGRRTTWCEFGK